MSDKIKIYLLVSVIALSALFLIFSYTGPLKTAPEKIPEPPISADVQTQKSVEVASSTSVTKSIVSYSYLFKEEIKPTVSNIVGYFDGGAFAWYIPDWLVENWTLDKTLSEKDTTFTMIFTPKARENDDNFSDIVLTTKPSTETFNAATLYDNEVKSTNHSDLIINEVLLNKHTEGWLTIIIETDTRIYHVQKLVSNKTKDIYYIDGNGRTLVATFEAHTDIFSQFSSKIRGLIEGIGEIKALQG